MTTDIVIKNLLRNCIYQRAKGTPRVNDYPEAEHKRDCDICQAADELKRLKEIERVWLAQCDLFNKHSEWCQETEHIIAALSEIAKSAVLGS